MESEKRTSVVCVSFLVKSRPSLRWKTKDGVGVSRGVGLGSLKIIGHEVTMAIKFLYIHTKLNMNKERADKFWIRPKSSDVGARKRAWGRVSQKFRN